MKNYISPFMINDKIIDYISNIMENVGKLSNYKHFYKTPALRRENIINSVHSSLSIERNSLSHTQVKNVLAGRKVNASQFEIQEIKNAYNAYESLDDINPYSLKDLKKSHEIIEHSIMREAGKFRNDTDGVLDEHGNFIHIGPSPEEINVLMTQLFEFVKQRKDSVHPLILSSIFHYEFIFVHPFDDGNGRLARLWQKAMLSEWKELFKYLPIEAEIKENQEEYYKAIAECNKKSSSTIFIVFMLKMINNSLEKALKAKKPSLTENSICIDKLLSIMKTNTPMSANEIMTKLKIKSKETLRSTYLSPAIKEGFIALTIPDKPTSRKQMYYRT